MSNRWSFAGRVRSAAEDCFEEGEKGLVLFGHDANRWFAVIDGRLKPYGDVGLIVMRAVVEEREGVPRIHYQRVPTDCLVSSNTDPEAVEMRLGAYIDPTTDKVVIAGGILTLHVGVYHPHGSTFDGQAIFPVDFWGRDVPPLVETAAEAKGILVPV